MTTYRDTQASDRTGWAILFCAFILFGIVGAMDHADEQRAHEHYCDMIEQGHWPDDGRMARGDCDED